MLRAALLAAAFAATPALAQTPPGGFGAILGCAGLEADGERLACFDREAAALRSRDVVAVPARDVEELRRESYGFNLPSLERVAPAPPGAEEREPDRTRSWTVQSIRNARSGRAVFIMDDGQVWQQTDGDGQRFPEPGRRGAVVTAEIRPAAFGSYLLSVSQDGRRRGGSVRVRRVR